MNKKISMSLLENTAEQIWNNNRAIMDSMFDRAILDMAKHKNKIFALLIISRAIYDNITIRQVLNNYTIEEIPVEQPFVKDFKDLKLRPLKFEIESQMRLVPRKKKIRISDADFEIVKTSLLLELSESFNGKQVIDE